MKDEEVKKSILDLHEDKSEDELNFIIKDS